MPRALTGSLFGSCSGCALLVGYATQLYSISIIALISLAKVEGGFYTSPNFI